MAKKKEEKEKDKKKFEYRYEIVGLIYIVLSIIGILGPKMGLVGKIVSAFAMFLVGVAYGILLLGTLAIGIYLIIKRNYPKFVSLRLIGFYIFAMGILCFIHMKYVTANSGDIKLIFTETINNYMASTANPHIIAGGGIIGAILASLGVLLFNIDGTMIVAMLLLVIGVILFFNISIFELIKKLFSKIKNSLPKRVKKEKKLVKDVSESVVVTNVKTADVHPIVEEKEILEKLELEPLKIPEIKKGYKLPSITILDQPKKTNSSDNASEVKKNIEILERVLKDFDVSGKVVEVHIGPSVTQYELEIKAGTKLTKIVSLNKELALALACRDVRIQAPIPGKNTIGIELANKHNTPVTMREVLSEFINNKKDGLLTFALGKNIMGDAVYFDLAKTPHMLVAGSTGSGKSVCINGIIVSLLMRAKPDEVKLVLVDPKKVELSGYNGVPHLLAPVVTDPKRANLALKKIVNEMERRYELFSEYNVKNIAGYNEMVSAKNITSGKEVMKRLSYIVVIIDELADLMLVAAKEVEDSIMRITQMARAAGIHLIVATQRPSTDVITGVVKANIPSRLSFAVSSSIDSRTILDMSGAEKLLGKGDMLFSPMGENVPMRIQGSYLSDDEIKRVIDYTCAEQKAEYDMDLLDSNEDDYNKSPKDSYDDSNDSADDPLYNEIVEFARQTGKISASLVQRKYRLGYNRAARIIDLLEERGVIGPPNGSKPREVLGRENNEE